MIWILFAVVTASAIVAVVRPLGRAAQAAAGGASEIEAYKLQLAELDREQELGSIGSEEAQQTRTEISRRLLKAGRQGAAAVSGEATAIDKNFAFAALAGVIALGAAGLYAIYGSPSLPDQPLEARLSAPPSEQTLGIRIANVERQLRSNPDNAALWTNLAPIYFRTMQFDKAARAYRKAIKLGGQDEEKLMGLFESLVYANKGNVPAEAKTVLDTAIATYPKSLRVRTWLAIRTTQEGKKSEAEQIYREMLSEDPPAAWKTLIGKRLEALKDEPDTPATKAPAGVQHSAQTAGVRQAPPIGALVERLAARLKRDGSDLTGWLMLIRSYAMLQQPEKMQEAAASARKQFASDGQALKKIDAVMSIGKAPAETPAASGQAAMIRGMVDRLAARLKENGADLDGWLRLIRSYSVLHETAKAQEATASARKQFASEPQKLERIDALTRELGLPAADGKGEQPKQ